MAFQKITTYTVDSNKILEVQILPTLVLGGNQRIMVNRLFLCNGHVDFNFAAPGYTPDEGELTFPLVDDDGTPLLFDPVTDDLLIRSTVHVSVNEFHNDDGEQFHFGVGDAYVSDEFAHRLRSLTNGKMYVTAKMYVAGGDKSHDGHIYRLGYHVELLGRIARFPEVKLEIAKL